MAKLIILGASYGLANVTEKVQALCKNDSLEIRVSNDIFGDGWKGNRKTLVVVYRYEGRQTKSVWTIEGEELRISEGYYTESYALTDKLRILGAVYGLADVSEIVRKTAGDHSVIIRANNAKFTDTWRFHPKVLTIVYQIGKQAPKISITAEGLEAEIKVNSEIFEPNMVIPINELITSRRLGGGAYGDVYETRWREKTVAAKFLKVDRPLTKTALQAFNKEVTLMTELNHQNVILCYGACQQLGQYVIVMQYMASDLYVKLHDGQNFAWDLRLKISIDISVGLSYLHENNILHRDLKSLNILLDSDNTAKITDFGLSAVRSELQITTPVSEQRIGTPLWMAPELFDPKITGVRYTQSADVYSFGIILWEIATRSIPYQDKGFTMIYQIIEYVRAGNREEIPRNCSQGYAALIGRCWDQRNTRRPTMKEATVYLKEQLEIQLSEEIAKLKI